MKPLGEIVKYEAILQHFHCTWMQLQVQEREKRDHHFRHLNDKIGRNSLQGQMVAGPRQSNNHQYVKAKIIIQQYLKN